MRLKLMTAQAPTEGRPAVAISSVVMAAGLALIAAACGSGAKLSASSSGVAAKAPVHAAPIVLEMNTPNYNEILTTATGFALYTYTADARGGPGCTGGCLRYWPPLLLPAGATSPVADQGVSGIGTLARGDRLQVTYHGLPLYTYITDTRPGQVTGQNVVDGGGTWILATVNPSEPAATGTQLPPNTTSAANTSPPTTKTTAAATTQPAPATPSVTSPPAPPRTSPPTPPTPPPPPRTSPPAPPPPPAAPTPPTPPPPPRTSPPAPTTAPAGLPSY